MGKKNGEKDEFTQGTNGAGASGQRRDRHLKLPAASCRESSILKEVSYSNRSLTPQQTAGNALAPDSSGKKLGNANTFSYRTSGHKVRSPACPGWLMTDRGCWAGKGPRTGRLLSGRAVIQRCVDVRDQTLSAGPRQPHLRANRSQCHAPAFSCGASSHRSAGPRRRRPCCLSWFPAPS